jgi:RHS repeat-associated protein
LRSHGSKRSPPPFEARGRAPPTAARRGTESKGRSPPPPRTDVREGQDARRPEAEHGTGWASRRWPGHYYDPETGLHYNRWRYYDPTLGRYLQSDPLGYAGSPVNLYAYAPNPPVQVDLLGLACDSDDGESHPKDSDGQEGPPRDGADDGSPMMSKEDARNLVEARSRATVDAMSKREGDAAVVHSGVVDRRTGEYFEGTNQSGPPDPLHPILRDRIDAQNQRIADGGDGHPSEAGSHAEVHAQNDALMAREADPANPTLTENDVDFNDSTQNSTWTKGNSDPPGGMNRGEPAPQCGNCQQITDGVDNVSGNAPPWTQDDAGNWVPPPR